MRKPDRRRWIAIGGGLAVLAAVTGSVAAFAGGTQPPALLQASEPGSGHAARAFGAAGSAPAPLFALSNGDQVALLVGSTSKCLVMTRGGRPAGEVCAQDANLSNGEGISVTDECGSSSNHLMEITGLAPEGVTETILHLSDRSLQSTPVVGGAFRFEGKNPTGNEPYPISVSWLAGQSTEGSAALPVSEGRFCLPAE